MSWLAKYRIRHYFRDSLWIAPVSGMVLALAAVRGVWWLDAALGRSAVPQPETARALLITMAGVMFSLIVFLCSALLIVVQLASAQLTPRIIGLLFRDVPTKAVLSLFVFTFAFLIGLALRVRDSVPLISWTCAAYGSVFSMAAFLYLVDHIGRTLRPSSALRRVAAAGANVVDQVYRRPFEETAPGAPAAEAVVKSPAAAAAKSVDVFSAQDGMVLAFDVAGLRSIAQRGDCLIEMVPRVGDHVGKGDRLFRVLGGDGRVDPDTLHQSVAIGRERTLEQDPMFAFRIIVDIASKALSPAINDPTTAVLAIDQIHRLLRRVGTRRLDEERVRDSAGKLRLVYTTPDWEDFVHLAVTEIRQFGSESIQIVRRLRAMLENLIQTLPPSRAALLREELNRLQKSAERCFSDPEDRALAQVGDPQGVGGGGGRD